MEMIEIYSPALENNLVGDSATKSLIVHLPPGYESGDQRYPVVYLTHAIGTGPMLQAGIGSVLNDSTLAVT
jgi:hypothetical protein